MNLSKISVKLIVPEWLQLNHSHVSLLDSSDMFFGQRVNLSTGFVRLGMMMLYNDTCPSKYVAPSFRAGDHETLKILKTAQGDSGLSLDTGFHEYVYSHAHPSVLNSAGFLLDGLSIHNFRIIPSETLQLQAIL